MEKIIETVYEEVKKHCMLPSNAYGIGAWEHHIELVYKIALKNCDLYGADKNIVALAALLHDIASVTNKDFTEEHHTIGASIAEDILKEHNLSNEQVDLIKKCILNHRGSRLVEKNTPEEICIADSDAMAHFYSIPSLLRMAYVEKKMTIDEGRDFVFQKVKRSYNKLSRQGKDLIKEEYEAAQIVLKSI